MDAQLLHDLGITGHEAAVFRAVCRAGRVTPAQISVATNIKRTTAYHLARTLAERGLLIEDATKRPREFAPADAETIGALIDAERKRFLMREKRLKRLVDEISTTTAAPHYPVPHVRFITAEKLERFLYQETTTWHKSLMATDKTWWGFQDHSFIDHFGKITDWYWRKTKGDFTVKLLSNRSVTEEKIAYKYARRTMKYWPKQAQFHSTTWVVGEYVVMVNTRHEPFYLVEIHDATLAHDLREVFRGVWPLAG